MKYKSLFYLLFLFGLGLTAQPTQDLEDIINQDDLGNVSDQFQELFFKAIAQRAIENQEKAIDLLNQLQEIDENEMVVYLEMAKNQLDLKKYDEAEKNFLKALDLAEETQKFHIQERLLKVYEAEKNYAKGIALLEELSQVDVGYLELLANLHLITNNYKKAHESLDALVLERGNSSQYCSLRDVIFKESEDLKGAVKYYQKRIEEAPKNQELYIRLIGFYKLQGKSKKVEETALQLEEFAPNNQDLHVVLSLFYLAQTDVDSAFPYAEKVIHNNQIPEEQKIQVISAFKKVAEQNPDFKPKLIQLLDQAIAEGKSSASNREMGNFQLKNNQRDEALKSYKKALVDKPNDFQLLQKIILLEIDLHKFEEAEKTAEKALDQFPAQAVLYLFSGIAKNNLGKSEEAIEVLEEGLGYLFDNPETEVAFLEQLSEAHSVLGNKKESEKFKNQALEIKK
ncbi:MAG: tetratricopeptide repeat protein [Flavobacteriaceae bacterium]|nr:tetratricopeptide repeat protein [Flavobacteriaceae bacterium]